MKARLGIPAVLILLLLTSSASASVSNDQVQSQHIREADGTSGQNTNSGAGVKTGHIQNSAVTSDKIQDGQVLSADLATGAVTDAKISGVISATKLPVGTTAGTVAAGNHNHDNLYQKKYANVVVVAKSGGDFTDPIAAINSITDASINNGYLVKIMPGSYNIGTGIVRMKDYVDIEGSGEKVTTISGSAITNIFDPTAAVVIGANNAELRLVTINGYGTPQIAILNVGTSPTFSYVTVNAFGGGMSDAYGVVNTQSAAPVMRNMTINAPSGWQGIGVRNFSATPVITNSKITVKDAGIWDYYSSSNAKDLTITSGSIGILLESSTGSLDGLVINAPTGISVRDSSPKLARVEIHATVAIGIGGTIANLLIDQSNLEGSEFSIIYDIGFGGSVRIGASKLVGPRSFGSLEAICVGAYDGTYTALGTACE